MDPTPRKIKRLVNVYRLVRTLSERHPEDLVERAPAKVVLWLLLAQQWPYAMACILDAYRRTDDETDLEKLYDIVADKLDDDPRHRALDYDNFILDDVIAHFGEHISGEDIHGLQALTLNFHPALASEIRAFMD
jgi:hypothetical protein